MNVLWAGSNPRLINALPICSAIVLTWEYLIHLNGSLVDGFQPK